MKKQLMAGMMAASMALSLAACGGSAASSAASAADSTSGAASTSTAASTSSDEQVTLRFAWWGGDERANATMEVINKFMEENPNIKIEAEYGSSDGYHDKLATQLASGTAADIVQIDPETMPAFVSTGDYFLDYKDYDFDLSNFDPNYIGLRVNGNFDGKQLGLPTGIAGPALVVNEELAEKYGITAPLTRTGPKRLYKDNRNLDLSARPAMANRLKADAFVSIHCNGAVAPEANGFEIYTTPGQNRSDILATAIFESWSKAFPAQRKRTDYRDNDPDKVIVP